MTTFVCLILATAELVVPGDAMASERWRAPFDSAASAGVTDDTVLTFDDVLRRVAAHNPTLQSLLFQEQAAQGAMTQAGLWPNPEIEVEAEEVGWDAPGLTESEVAVVLAQEFELFGQRGARKEFAQSEIRATRLRTRQAAFDLYLDAKERFYALAHAQTRLKLADTSVSLAEGIVANIDFRIGKGAALQSEYLLAQLEKHRAELQREQARQALSVARMALVSLWNGAAADPPLRVAADSEPPFTRTIEELPDVEHLIDSTRAVVQFRAESDRLQAEQSLAAADARPSLTVRGGYKRVQANESNSFVLGVGFPLPFLNRNQGIRQELEARRRSIDYEIERARMEARSAIYSNVTTLEQLIRRHDTLDSLLLPTAADAYRTLQAAYEAGRVPYTQLLEAERSLNELRAEHADLLLSIHQHIIALERVTGVTLRLDRES
ncbi:MAG: TolC family protein [Candidatus Zixiibacteriota bacterium]